MIKGNVFILLPKSSKEILSQCINDICERIIKEGGTIDGKSLNNHFIETNGYTIYVLNGILWSMRGYIAEISYIYNSLKPSNQEDEMFLKYDICWKTETYSTRKKPVRYINDWSEINFKEIIDDKYAKENTIVNRSVFLGGTCNGSTWRDKLIKMLNVDFFNPVVEDWTEECVEEEIRQKEKCGYCLYCITPSMTGVYNIAEVVNDSNRKPKRTIFCVLENEIETQPNLLLNSKKMSFTADELKSLEQVGNMIFSKGGNYFKSLEDVASFLNNKKQ